MGKRSRVTFHNVQLTADPTFRSALDAWIEHQRLQKGVSRYPASMIHIALETLAGRTGRELEPLVAGFDFSVEGRSGAVRVTGALWRRASQIATHLSRTSAHACAVTWAPRTVIITALYCHVTGR